MKTTLKPPKNLGLKEGRGALVGKTSTEARPQRFVSGVQLSQLVQKRLGQTMRKFVSLKLLILLRGLVVLGRA